MRGMLPTPPCMRFVLRCCVHRDFVAEQPCLMMGARSYTCKPLPLITQRLCSLLALNVRAASAMFIFGRQICRLPAAIGLQGAA